jgi:hypothetical protein
MRARPHGAGPLIAAAAAAAITAGFVPVTLAGTAAADVPDDHLVLAYDFEDEQDGVVDDVSSSGLDGVLVNPGAAAQVSGRAAGSTALDLTGGGPTSTTAPYVEIPHGLFAGRSQITIATWVRWDGGPDFQWVYNLGRDKDRATFLTPSFQSDTRTRSSIKPVNGSSEVGVSGSAKLPAGTWVQAVTTIDGAQLTYYLNGVEVGREAARLDLASVMHADSGTTSGFLGKAFWTGHPFFDGALDDFRVYDVALSAGQVAGIYDGALPTMESVTRTQFDVQTTVGTAPALPASVEATFSDGIGRQVRLEWDAVDPASYARRGTFTVTGAVAGHDTQVQATVQVLATDTITVDLGEDTGDFLGGASGTLYGLYDQGLPSNNLVDGVKLKTVATKAQDGPQHPGADALEVVRPLADSSDGDVYIYMTDVHRGFPYEWPGDTPEEKLDTYLEKIRVQAEQVRSMPEEYQDNVVLMPYNEPEGNMFGTGTWSYNRISWLNDPRYFFDAWDRAHDVIRSVLPDARIGGPNTSLLYNQVKGFLDHTVEAGNVPDVMVWHELSNPAAIRTNVARYRTWETEVFAGSAYEGTRLPINISEYAYNYHTSVPGQMIQWVSALEDVKAYGDIAYWNIDGNMSDSAVQANRANGQWWLLNAYSQMSGRTVAVTPPRPNVSYTLQGVATLDRAKKQARTLLGGAGGAYTVAFDDVPADVFGDQVHVTVREIGWSGQIGDSEQPAVVGELDLPVTDGAVDVRFGGGDLPALSAESAYEVIVTPGEVPQVPAVAPTTWSSTYEAENAAHTGAGWSRNGPEGTPSAVAKFYTSGTYNVGGLRTGANVTLDFAVSVPQDGTYDLSVFANSLNTAEIVQDQGPTNVFLRVDGDSATEQELFLSLGYKWVVWDHTDTTVDLTAGDHVITLASRSLDGTGATRGDAIVDKIDLALPNPDHDHDVYEAELAELSDGASPTYEHHGTSGSGTADIPDGASATFWVHAPDAGGARLDVDTLAGGAVDLVVNGDEVRSGTDGSVGVFLEGGVNKVVVPGSAGLVVDRLRVSPDSELTRATYEAEDALTAGTANEAELSLASGGVAVTGIGGEPGNGNTLTFDAVEVDEAGRYALTFRYSNEEQAPSTHYNPDPVARYAHVSVNGADPVRVVFPHSFHENNFWELSVPVELAAGANTITVRGEEKPNFDGETYASDTWPGVPLRSRYAPNIDRIAITPLFGDAVVVPDWDARTAYSTGARVVHEGAEYVAGWPTKNQEPGATPWGAWQEVPPARADGVAEWAASRVYQEGDVARHDGVVYVARWWTRNQVPGNENGPWRVR